MYRRIDDTDVPLRRQQDRGELRSHEVHAQPGREGEPVTLGRRVGGGATCRNAARQWFRTGQDRATAAGRERGGAEEHVVERAYVRVGTRSEVRLADQLRCCVEFAA